MIKKGVILILIYLGLEWSLYLSYNNPPVECRLQCSSGQSKTNWLWLQGEEDGQTSSEDCQTCSQELDMITGRVSLRAANILYFISIRLRKERKLTLVHIT